MKPVAAFALVLAFFADVLHFSAAWVQLHTLNRPEYMAVWIIANMCLVAFLVTLYLHRKRQREAAVAQVIAEKLTGKTMTEALVDSDGRSMTELQPAHSKSEYKRRVAMGDPNVAPPSGVKERRNCSSRLKGPFWGPCDCGLNCDTSGVGGTDGR